ncbi:MAG UNVERIFIED_CONTAM: hypothetical protein LVR18_38395 [Planctomycetaceae bacterium]|jgi:hypothetical protein
MELLSEITSITPVSELVAAFGGILSARRTVAQLELLRRGSAVTEELCRLIERGAGRAAGNVDSLDARAAAFTG